MAVFWDVLLCSLVDINQCLSQIMKAISSSEMLVRIYQTMQRNISEKALFILVAMSILNRTDIDVFEQLNAGKKSTVKYNLLFFYL
jgi:hypothetical protein